MRWYLAGIRSVRTRLSLYRITRATPFLPLKTPPDRTRFLLLHDPIRRRCLSPFRTTPPRPRRRLPSYYAGPLIHSPSAREKLPRPAKMDRRPTLPSWKKPQDFQESQDGTASHFSVSPGSVPAFEQDAIHFFKSGKGRGPRIWGCNAQAVSVRLSAAPPDPFGTMPVDHAQSLGIFRISRVVRPPVSIPKSFLIPLTSSVY